MDPRIALALISTNQLGLMSTSAGNDFTPY